MLYDLIGRQDAGRERLLESAPLSRRALASRFKVSRSHVERVFAKAEQAGYLSLQNRNRVHFSEAMSEEAEQHFALTFHVVAASAFGAMEAVRGAGEISAAKKGRSRPGP
jgi:DNA-binding transcriptional regulator LsrR (DeoR family)